MNPYWQDRGFPWEYDPGPPKNRKWPRLFAEAPNYRGLSKALLGQERHRWHFGPMFYRGRLGDNAVKVLVIGQEGGQDESLSHRAFTGGSGSRMQYFLRYLGITESYLFLNTFVYPIFGQYDSSLKWLAQNPDSPVVKHRHEIFDYVLEKNDLRLVIAVGNAAKESVVTWIESRGGSCPAGIQDISQCSAQHLDPHTRVVGVMHPGGAGQGGSVAAIVANFNQAIDKIKQWISEEPSWLPADSPELRNFGEPYKYRSAPIPFRDFAYGFPIRLGRGSTSSNRKDSQRSIQLFSAGGVYNAQGVQLTYQDQAKGSADGYAEDPGDVPYEPPKQKYADYDKGPGSAFARLLMGGQPGLAWPDFNDLGAAAHPSFGQGPIYRGRPDQATVLILADQQSHDDLFTGRALTGDSGQHMQLFLEAMGILSDYLILRVLPVDTLALAPATVATIVAHPQVQKVYQAIIDKVMAQGHSPQLVLTFGPQAAALASQLDLAGRPLVSLKAWREGSALSDWQSKLAAIEQMEYDREVTDPSFAYDGGRGQIPRFDLPYGHLRWMGSSGNRASQPIDESTQSESPDYYKLYMPQWAFGLQPLPLSAAEQAAVDSAEP